MAGFVQKEKYEGTWRGANVAFNRTYSGRRLTDAECEALCRDEDVELRGLVSKGGAEYGIIGHLAHLEYNGHPYVGIEKVGRPERKPGEKLGIPAAMCGHRFSQEELEALKAGKAVHCKGLKSSKGKVFDADLTYDEGQDRILFAFGH